MNRNMFKSYNLTNEEDNRMFGIDQTKLNIDRIQFHVCVFKNSEVGIIAHCKNEKMINKTIEYGFDMEG